MEFKNHHKLDLHTIVCAHNPDNLATNLPLYSPETQVFYHAKRFHLVTFCQCLIAGSSRCELLEDLIRGGIHGSENVHSFNLSRSFIMDNELRAEIKAGNLLNTMSREVNYLYGSMSTNYAIVSEILFHDTFIKEPEIIHDDYKEVIEYIHSIDHSYLEQDLTKLYNINKEMVWGGVSHKTIQEFNKYFRKQIRNKKKSYETSKH